MRVLLGVSGSVAAHKGLILGRLLKKRGHEVKVILTRAAEEFVRALAFESLVGETFTEGDFFRGALHVELAQWAELPVLAPATARTLAKLRTALAEDLLSATFLLKGPPGVIVPAMHTGLWLNPAVQEAVRWLERAGYKVVEPVEGDLSQGRGLGRMPEPEELLPLVEAWEGVFGALKGRAVIVAYGPTAEPLDPVRLITNRSSGKLGVELCRAFKWAGAKVLAVAGFGAPPCPADELVRAETTEEMARAVAERAPGVDVLVMAAAVADFRPAEVSQKKLRRAEGLTLRLLPTQDILASVEVKGLKVGFALGSREELLERAREKLLEKGADLVVANPPEAMGADEAEFWLVDRGGVRPLGRLSKPQLAVALLKEVAERLEG